MNTAPTVSEQERQVYDAICAIAAHCDGAVSDDGQGFNGQDTLFGRRIAAEPFENWNQDIRDEAARLARRYHVQAANYGHEVGELPIVVDALRETNTAARNEARKLARRRNYRALYRIILTKGNGNGQELQFHSPYDADFKDAIKAQGARWDGGSWNVLVSDVNTAIANIAVTFDFNFGNDVEHILTGAPEGTGPVNTVVLKNGVQPHLRVSLGRKLGKKLFDEYRQLDGYRWIRGGKESNLAVTARNIMWLRDNGFDGIEEVAEQAKDVIDRFEQRIATNIAASRAQDADIDLSAVVPEGLAPYGFQKAGVAYALKARRTFVADEMGLGKTIQAILTVKAAETFPVVVVCPATLKGNWAKEIRFWDPEASVTVLNGRKVSAEDQEAALSGGFDYIIVNYNVVEAWTNAIVKYIAPQALVMDESHYVKNPKAKRTGALMTLSQAIPREGLVLGLTGTPILNRPVELVTQLQVLGQLRSIAATEVKFKQRYCGPTYNGWGWNYNGTSNEEELNMKLRAVCMVRRERTDVLDMKETHRVQIPLSLNGKLKEYRAAERNIIEFISERSGTAAAIKAAKAEILVQLNVLRRLAEEAKVDAAIEWIEDWLESYPTKKLVVFAGHRTVQQALAQHFGCPTILGGQRDPEAQKLQFQEGDARVIVCSLQAAREGHTLTAASDVVFTSLGWTPGGLQQAEDRCNRIGQEADKVVAWQLHAEGTVDETIGALIEAKRQVFNAVIKGEGEEEEDVLEGVIEYLRGKA